MIKLGLVDHALLTLEEVLKVQKFRTEKNLRLLLSCFIIQQTFFESIYDLLSELQKLTSTASKKLTSISFEISSSFHEPATKKSKNSINSLKNSNSEEHQKSN